MRQQKFEAALAHIKGMTDPAVRAQHVLTVETLNKLLDAVNAAASEALRRD